MCNRGSISHKLFSREDPAGAIYFSETVDSFLKEIEQQHNLALRGPSQPLLPLDHIYWSVPDFSVALPLELVTT